MKRAARIAPITSLQPPYSLLVRKIEPKIVPYVQANGIGLLAYSPMRRPADRKNDQRACAQAAGGRLAEPG